MDTIAIPATGKTLSVIIIRNPFDPHGSREFRMVDYKPGASVADYVKGLITPLDDYVVSRNGGVIPSALVPTTTVRPGDQLVVCPVVEGDTGKMVGRIIGMIAVMIVAWYVAPFIAPGFVALGLTESLAFAAAYTTVFVAGSLLVNALLPMPRPDLSLPAGDFGLSQTYGWNGLQNLAQQGIPISVLYGKHKLAGNVISRNVTTDGEKQYLNVLSGLVEGPIQSIADVQVNDNPISNFGTSMVEYVLNVPITSPHEETTVQSNVTSLEVDIFFPNGLYFVTHGADEPTSGGGGGQGEPGDGDTF